MSMMNRICLKMIEGIMMVCLVMQVVCGEQEIRCIQSERQALLQFKASILDYGGILSSWTTSDCCQWMGIRCSNLTGHVIMLDLHGNWWDPDDAYRITSGPLIRGDIGYEYSNFDGVYRNTSGRYIRGEIHKSLIELQQLQYLDLSRNHFEGSHIPEFFASLTNLRYLDLSSSHFGGKIPTQFGSLSHLKYLNLARNRLKGSIPYQLGNLSNLQYLYLWGNWLLEGKIPSQLGNLSNLKYLVLSFNSLEGKIPSQLGNLSNLQYLDLSANSLKGDIPSQLGKLSNLQTLYLSGGYDSALKIGDGDQARGQWLSNLTSLTRLNFWSISNLDSSHSWLQMIGKLPNLEELSLSECSLSDHFLLPLGPSKINFSTSLSVLDLSRNTFTSPMIFQWVSNITTNLVELDLSGNFLDASTSNHHLATKMVKLPKLRELRLSYCNLSDNFLHSMIPSKFNFSTSLAILDLSDNIFTSFMIFRWVSNVCPNLIELDLSNNKLLVGSTSDHVGIMMNSLKRLDLSSSSLKGGVLNSFMNICTLHSLNLKENNLTEDFASILHNLSGGCVRNSLQQLDLSNNQIIGTLTDLSVFSSLKMLDLSNNCLSGKILEGSKLPPQLESLSIRENFLEGGVPISFENVCVLDSLDLSFNYLNEELPVIIHHLSGCARYSLQELSLRGNKINGTLPDLSIFSTLKTLDLSENQLSGKIPNGNKLPSQLESLSIRSNILEGGIPKSFGNACALRKLDMFNNSLSEELPVIINHLSGCARYSLQILDLCMNQINGTLPNLSIFSSLKNLYLNENKLNGRIHENMRFPTQLEDLYMNSNSLEGVITESHFSNMSKLIMLELSGNSLTLAFAHNWVPPFQLYHIGLRSCKLGQNFPKWLQTQNKFRTLDISSGGISDVVPEWFWAKLQSFAMRRINISYNNLQGTIPNLPPQNTYESLLLASNQFEGSIPPFLQGSTILDLSKNKFSASQSFLCANHSVERLRSLDLSKNQLFGQIPDCWSHFESLAYLDLSHNNFSGKIPTSMGSLLKLQALLLRNNNLSNEMPFSLSNCTMLVMLDAGENRLSGVVPSWIGSKLQELQVLSLPRNHFSGSLPLQICYLQNLQILDLSFNNLSGQIPKCMKNFTSMAQDTSSRYYENHTYDSVSPFLRNGLKYIGSYKLKASVTWKGDEEMFMNQTLYLLKSIDLSSNLLSEEIPTEIESLLELVSLNLSRNNLTGKIPSNIGRLTSLEFLDLSRNQISGSIPTSLTQIDRLAMLDLSHNLLYGEIPTGTQLQSFDASCYADNLDLCGKPLAKLCIEEKPQQNPIDKSLDDEHSFFSRGFTMSMAFGFAIGFWGSFGSILIKRSWRRAYFKFLNKVADNIYVRVVMTCAKIPKLAKGR